MFGSTILVPKLVGMSPAVALVTSGIGTLAYLLVTKGQIPAYLGAEISGNLAFCHQEIGECPDSARDKRHSRAHSDQFRHEYG